ncbi:monovalent cation/H(+) antiporter subunit G [Solirubrobacter sp. CPCC 204708]|uniref:Monovalent cation/H(+) antiporter subunit G n=1 Tax=Solirubrobacter deserti TaxID=2282478 RepID=A0ABT4RV74_9ACTN|nr:monovalent cation/H(+) antiporter subunit G [Solirubrobacter deserti]MBE2321035.1 monovalent cation/H(+) antiporter subunit G [Solirubrobacter deserti]MDA0142488.1 monovalent cation/H(+) antiporter subunit G [Solirubrobacter deserti]
MTAVAADVLTLLGLLLLTVGVYGVVRLPDAYTQLHSASKAGFLGVAALLAAASVSGEGAIIARAFLIVALLAVTTPVASHAVARAAYRRGERMRTPNAVNETKDRDVQPTRSP